MNQDLTKISHVWRAGRLLLGLTQKELAKHLNISQGTVSKYESMQLEPSASDWYNFCQIAGIDAHKTLELGYIDGKKKFKHRLYGDSLFTVPLKYRGDFLLKVRELVPFKEAVLNTLKHDFWNKTLKDKGLVPEMFFVYDFQLSYNFLNEIVVECAKENVDLWSEALKFSGLSSGHGSLFEEYQKKRKASDLVESLVQYQPLYQRAFEVEYQVSEEAHCVLRPSGLALESFEKDDLRPFMRYKINSFKAMIRAKQFSPRMIVEEYPEYMTLSFAG